MKLKLNSNYVTLVDKDVYELIKKDKWFYGVGGSYVGKNIGSGKQILLHRFIMNTPKGLHTDHINGNHLDNRRCNLRICTAAQNQFNSRKHKIQTSKYKGVSWYKRDKCWRAYININKRQIHLGYFSDETKAAKRYNTEAKRLYKQYAFVNTV